jgi:alkylation response protein AidB-like acyl-CoA dehydrogenase
MNFTLSDEQQELQATVRQFVAANVSGREPMSDATWQQMVDLGWVSLLIPEAQGGAGMGLLEMMVVLEELGRVPATGPFLSSAVLATLAARGLGLDDRLSSLAAGATRGTVAIDERGHGDVLERLRTRASRKSGAWLLSGEKPLVMDVDSADWVLIPARTQQGIGTFLIEKPTFEEVKTLDVTRSIGRMVLADTPAIPVGPDVDHTAVWRRVVDDGAVAIAAGLLGTMQASFDLAVEYAKVRVQFDRPIATFQATKHKAAELLERIELSRVGIHYAAWASDDDEPVRAEAAAMAKSFSGKAAIEVTGEGIQIHGGVGFTWDCDAHLYYRRAKSDDLLLGYHGTWRHKVGESYLATA